MIVVLSSVELSLILVLIMMLEWVRVRFVLDYVEMMSVRGQTLLLPGEGVTGQSSSSLFPHVVISISPCGVCPHCSCEICLCEICLFACFGLFCFCFGRNDTVCHFASQRCSLTWLWLRFAYDVMISLLSLWMVLSCVELIRLHVVSLTTQVLFFHIRRSSVLCLACLLTLTFTSSLCPQCVVEVLLSCCLLTVIEPWSSYTRV